MKMESLFNAKWFIQLLIKQILFKPFERVGRRDVNVARSSLLQLFCVNKACASFGRANTKFIILVTDDSNMPLYQYRYIYDTHFEALCRLHNIMINHPPFREDAPLYI